MGKSREAALKRAREKARLEKREAKAAKRAARHSAKSQVPPIDEEKLWEQFAHLSERHQAGEISTRHYEETRKEILSALGLDSGG